MTPSIFIARILGPVLLIIGIGLLLEGETFRAMAGGFVRDQGLIYLTGLLTLAAGLAILNVHHLWTRDWRVLITIFGWLFLIGGIMRILALSTAQRLGEFDRPPPLADRGRGRHARARRLPHGHGLPGCVERRQAAAFPSGERGKEHAPGVAQRQAAAAQRRRGSRRRLIALPQGRARPRLLLSDTRRGPRVTSVRGEPRERG